MLGFADNRETSVFTPSCEEWTKMVTRVSLAFVVALLVGLSSQPVDAQDSKDPKGVTVKALVTSLGGFSATVNAPIFLTGATVDLEAGGQTGRPQFRVPTYIYVIEGVLTTFYESGAVCLSGAPHPAAGEALLGNGRGWVQQRKLPAQPHHDF